jgi:hypothetical protein
MNFFTALNKGNAFADIAKFNSESVSFPVCIPGFGMMSSYIGPQRWGYGMTLVRKRLNLLRRSPVGRKPSLIR